MEIFIIIIVFLIIWFVTSTSKSKDVKTAIKFAKEAKDGTNKFLDETNKFLDELSNNLDKFSSELEEKNIEKFKKSWGAKDSSYYIIDWKGMQDFL